VVLEVPQQLDHRLVAAGEIGAPELRVVSGAEERVDLDGVGLDRQAPEGLRHGGHEQRHVRVVARRRLCFQKHLQE
jgi:hypothetical protein